MAYVMYCCTSTRVSNVLVLRWRPVGQPGPCNRYQHGNCGPHVQGQLLGGRLCYTHGHRVGPGTADPAVRQGPAARFGGHTRAPTAAAPAGGGGSAAA